MKKVRSNCAKWQENCQDVRDSMIQNYLRMLRRTRVRVAYPTHLAKLIAIHLTEEQGSPCCASTIMRNPRYKAKVLSFMAHSGSAKGTKDSASDEARKADNLKAQLEVSNLRNEVKRLGVYAASLEEQLSARRAAPQLAHAAMSRQDGEPWLAAAKHDFARTCQLMTAVLDYMKVTLEIDVQERVIRDRSKLRNNVVASSVLAPMQN